MTDLKDFMSPPQTSVSDFGVSNVYVPPTNEVTNSVDSALTTVLSNSDNPANVFRQMNNEKQVGPNSPTQQAIEQQAQDAAKQRDRQAIVSVAPNTPPQGLQALADFYRKPIPKATLVKETLAAAASGHNETSESQDLRERVFHTVDMVNRIEDFKAAASNAAALRMADRSRMGVVGDFLSTLLPFSAQSQSGLIAHDMGITPSGFVGEDWTHIRKKIKEAPLNKQLELYQKAVNIANSNPGPVLSSNAITATTNLNNILNGDYSTFDRATDDLFSLLDYVGVGQMIHKGASVLKSGGEIAKAQDVLRNATKATVGDVPIKPASKEAKAVAEAIPKMMEEYDKQAVALSNVSPISVGVQAENFNPGVAKGLIGGVIADTTDKSANAIYGSSRLEALSRATLPQVPKWDGSIDVKVNIPSVKAELPDNLRISRGLYTLDPKEIESDTVVKTTKLQKVYPQATFERTEKGFNAQIVVGGVDSGFDNVADGINLVKFNLRHIGIQDDNINVLKRVGTEYKPVPKKEVEDKLKELQTRVDNPEYKKATAEADSHRTLRNNLMNEIKTLETNIEKNKYTPQQAMRQHEALDKLRAKKLELDTKVNSLQDKVDKINPKRDGDWKIGINFTHEITGDNFEGKFITLDVKRNWLDWLPASLGKYMGSLQSNFIDAFSSLNERIVGSASAAVNKGHVIEKKLATVGKDFAHAFTQHPYDRQFAIANFIRRSNEEGIAYNYYNFLREGFSEGEQKTLMKWKEAWDINWHLENQLYGEHLANRGYMLFYNKQFNVEHVISKPRRKHLVPKSPSVYDFKSKTVRRMTEAEVDRLYANGGTLGELRFPMEANGDAAEFIVSEEKAGGSYHTAIHKNAPVMNYREGYYHIAYNKNSKFIVKEISDKNGNVLYTQAISTADNLRDADTLAARLNAGNVDGKTRFFVRNDLKANSDTTFDIAHSRGMSNQRERGERLKSATELLGGTGEDHVQDPIEVLTKSVRNLSSRVSMQDWFNTTTNRFMSQYGHLINYKDKYGQALFPRSIKDIGQAGQIISKEIADARTTFEYIRQMRDGYLNVVDDGLKIVINTMADITGRKIPGKAGAITEKALRASSALVSPMGSLKQFARTVLITLNPIRQAIVQGHQFVRLAAIEPAYFGKQMWADMYGVHMALRDIDAGKAITSITGKTEKQYLQMAKELRESGVSLVDANEIIRGDLSKLAAVTTWDKIKNVVQFPLVLSQRAGFDAGEEWNMMTAWLTMRKRMVDKVGRFDLTERELEQVSAQASNITGNMNRAGTMPYSKTAASGIMQFMEITHKMLLQPYGNRMLNVGDKMRLLTFDTVVFGTGANLITGMIPDNWLPKDPKYRIVLEKGIEQWALNKALSLASAREVLIDFNSGLAPGTWTGTSSIIHSLVSSNLSDVLAKSPSSSFLFGPNPKLANLYQDVVRYMVPSRNYTDNPETFGHIVNDAMKLTSGWSNMYKAMMMRNYKQEVDAKGSPIGLYAGIAESAARIMGFGTVASEALAEARNATYTETKQFEQDITKWHKEHIRAMGIQDPNERNQAIVSSLEAFHHFPKTDKTYQMIEKLEKGELMKGQNTIAGEVMRLAEFAPQEDVETIMAKIPMEVLPQDMRDAIIDRVRTTQELIDEVGNE